MLPLTWDLTGGKGLGSRGITGNVCFVIFYEESSHVNRYIEQAHRVSPGANSAQQLSHQHCDTCLEPIDLPRAQRTPLSTITTHASASARAWTTNVELDPSSSPPSRPPSPEARQTTLSAVVITLAVKRSGSMRRSQEGRLFGVNASSRHVGNSLNGLCERWMSKPKCVPWSPADSR